MVISVIIPSLNEEDVIEQTVMLLRRHESKVGSQEVIVSDGGSTDRTVEISARLARVVESRSGRGRQMNKGAGEASGDVLLFLHADTVLPEKWDEKLSAVMADENIAGGAFDLSIDSDRLSHRIIAAAANIRSRLTGIPYGDQGIFVRRSVFKAIGGYKELPIMEDVELMSRLKKAGKIFLIKDKVKTSPRRWEKEGTIYTTLRNWLLISLYYLGVPPKGLYRLYKVIR